MQKMRGKNGFERKARTRARKRSPKLQQPRELRPSSSARPAPNLVAAQWSPPVHS